MEGLEAGCLEGAAGFPVVLINGRPSADGPVVLRRDDTQTQKRFRVKQRYRATRPVVVCGAVGRVASSTLLHACVVTADLAITLAIDVECDTDSDVTRETRTTTESDTELDRARQGEVKGRRAV